LSRLEDSSWRYFGPAEGLANGDIRKLMQDRKGVIWAGTGEGVASWSGSANWKTYAAADGLVPNTVLQLLETRSGDIWVGNEWRFASSLPLVSRYSGGSWTNYPASRGLWSSITALAEDLSGNVWALAAQGGRSRGLNRFDEHRAWTALTMEEGLQANSKIVSDLEKAGLFDLKSLLADRHGNVWVGTRAGLEPIRRYRLGTFD
jgi:ligand-binding sensor domain-containing protein